MELAYTFGMPFDPVDPKQSFPALENGILTYWHEEDTFRRSIDERAGGPTFSFYDGPPFATGLPHYGHLLAGTVKDVIPRYRTMRGDRVPRRFGWDCHGLPIENMIEKEQGIGSKREIEEMGVAKFNALCKASVQRYAKEWRMVTQRLGRWVDMDWDYRTMDPEYMESIWWVFQSLHEKGLIYEGHKPMHICPRCVTPLSNFEVTQGYKDITDVSVTAKFRLKETEGKTYFLAWTTTPWTLPGNLFLAVHPSVEYVKVQSEDAIYIVAKDLVERVFKDRPHAVAGKSFKGKSLVGMHYEPLFPYFASQYPKAFTVVAGDFVTTEDGTGIVHIAPGFGEDDFAVGKKMKVPLLQHVAMEGLFTKDVTDFAGEDVKPKDDPTKMDRKIAAWLEKHGKLFSTENYKHSYPHCWRCDSPLLNYATSSWFVSVEKIKEDLLTANAETEWVPAHIRDGRFGKWLEGARDWAISRARYWGTPLPIWRNADTGDLDVIGSRDDLMAHAKIRFTKVTALRHGESEGNLIPKYQGKVPGTDLTARGREQATIAATQLKDSNITVIYSSPLARARQTAEALAQATGAKVIIDERLREVSFGEYEGKTIDFSDLNLVRAKRAKKIEDGSFESVYHFPGMESWQSVQERIADFLQETLPKHRSEHIAIVTHADPIVNMRHFFTKEDPLKLSHQPFPEYARPTTFFWDHDVQAQMDLHKEFVDTVAWPGSPSKNSVELTIVRHGETDLNKEEVVQGSEIDAPLNVSGIAQAEKCAKEVKGKKFDVILSSPLKRAMQTAEIIAKALGQSVAETNSIFRERDLGEWTGKKITEVMEKFPIDLKGAKPAMHYHTPTRGESFSQFLQRARDAAAYIQSRYPGKRVLLIAHGGFIKGLQTVVENRTYQDAVEQSHPKNCELLQVSLHPLLHRIPEVLDCWFESGSMPYAQPHFPFEDRGQRTEDFGRTKKTSVRSPKSEVLPSGFPADFIAENLDQTRGWFYTLMVLSTALFKKPAFQHCICGGIILAEDGKKMSKRLKNYPDPMELMEEHGADGLRFAMMSSPVVRAETLRFSAKSVKEVVQNVLLPLWNAYGFFVTYANAARFEPVSTRTSSPHPLDRMIRAEIQDLTNRMTEQLDGYDLSATCSELHETIDVLTNWYIRLSRRRFAGKGAYDAPEANIEDHEADRQHALTTLYDVLLTLSQLLAPFCPFITESIYLNLVPQEHGSIHLTNWPQPRALTKEEKTMLAKTRMLRIVVSLGMKVRSEQKIKVRQPLAKATIALPPQLRKSVDLADEDRSLLRQELNVKELDVTDDPGKLGETIVQVDARKVGPRLGARVQEIIAAGKRGEFTQTPDGILILEELLTPDEAQIVYRGREGEGVAADKGIVVSIDMRVTEELKLEGEARDLIRAIQQLRKEQGYEFGEKVAIGIDEGEIGKELLQKFGTLIQQEANVGFGPREGDTHPVTIGEGKNISICIRPK